MPSMSYPTLTEIKRAKVARMTAAVEALAQDLIAYAREHGGRFILFGTAARGELRHDSDVDILADFPPDRSWDAVGYASDRAEGLGLVPDVQPFGLSGQGVRERVASEGRVLA